MANNVLTALAPNLFAALDTVSRELTGMIPSVSFNADNSQRVAIGDTIKVPIVGAANVGDNSPGMTVPDSTGQTPTTVSIAITKDRVAEFGFVGEGQRSLNNGVGYGTIQTNMIAQAMRSLVNEIESDLVAAYVSASRAYGTVGTIPFASGLGELAQAHRILVENGSPTTDKQMVLNTVAGASLRSNTGLTNVNQAGSADTLREGIFGRLTGFAVRESGQFIDHSGGTATLATVTGVEPVGETSLGVTTGATTGSIIFTAGDIITIAGDTNKYIVATDVTVGAGATGVVTIAAPGLKIATAGTEAITVSADYAMNMGFDRGAIQLVARPSSIPQEGDLAIDRMMLVDPVSGLAFEVAVYQGYKKVRYEVSLAWGVKVTKPEHTMLLIG